MHQPDSDCVIETIVDGERVCGTVHYGGSTELSVRLDCPSSERTISVHMPYFARPVHREGFLGEHGEQRALGFLISLYRDQKRGDRRRQFAGVGYEEFGRLRYLASNPGNPARGRQIREQAAISSKVYVQLEAQVPYAFARFFDSGTNQPFLAETAVCDVSIQQYVAGVKADPRFVEHLESVHRQLLPAMVRHAKLLKQYGVTPTQVDFLIEFGSNWRIGDMHLEAVEVEQLIGLGYLARYLDRCVAERAALEVSIARSMGALEKHEAAGRSKNAEQCRERIRKLQRRIDAKTLMITPLGKAVAESFPYMLSR